jgi:DNA-binding PadR family transcriptional regulator
MEFDMDRELLLLGLLRQEGMHGYQLAEFIQKDLASCTSLKKSAAYYVLDRMEKDGWVTRSTEREGNRPERYVYSITPAGEAVFQRLLRENLATYQPPTFESDVGLAFLDALPRSEAHRLLIQRREAIAGRLAGTAEVPVHQGSQQLVIEHLRHHLATELAWLDGIVARLVMPEPDAEPSA